MSVVTAERPPRLRALRLPSAWLAFAALMAAGVALRAWAMIAYSPAVLTNEVHDGADYVRAAHRGLSRGDQEPLGYPIFLRLIHSVSHQLAFTIGVQHALGLLTGTLLFMTARRLGASVWLALVPAAVVWLGGDELFLEHAPLSEALFITLVAAALYAGIRSLDGGVRWQLATGALAVAMLAVRSVALPLPLFLVGWLALARWRMRLPVWPHVALAAAAAAVGAFAYAAVVDQATNRWSIVAAGSGWELYGRAAEFADCRQFTPPRGTAALCDPTSPNRREGPEYYLYDGGPAHVAFGEPAAHDAQVRAFALAAIEAQPLDFLGAAGADAVRYVAPGFGRPQIEGFAGPQALAFPSGTPGLDPETQREVTAYYGPVAAPRRGAATGLRSYQGVVRVSGVTLLVLLIIGLSGVPIASGRVRWGIVLALLMALELLLMPTITLASWRLALPAEGPLAVAAVAAAQVLARRLAQRRPMRMTLTPSRSGT